MERTIIPFRIELDDKIMKTNQAYYHVLTKSVSYIKRISKNNSRQSSNHVLIDFSPLFEEIIRFEFFNPNTGNSVLNRNIVTLFNTLSVTLKDCNLHGLIIVDESDRLFSRLRMTLGHNKNLGVANANTTN